MMMTRMPRSWSRAATAAWRSPQSCSGSSGAMQRETAPQRILKEPRRDTAARHGLNASAFLAMFSCAVGFSPRLVTNLRPISQMVIVAEQLSASASGAIVRIGRSCLAPGPLIWKRRSLEGGIAALRGKAVYRD